MPSALAWQKLLLYKYSQVQCTTYSMVIHHLGFLLATYSLQSSGFFDPLPSRRSLQYNKVPLGSLGKYDDCQKSIKYSASFLSSPPKCRRSFFLQNKEVSITNSQMGRIGGKFIARPMSARKIKWLLQPSSRFWRKIYHT
jgi:hypothetical protein